MSNNSKTINLNENKIYIVKDNKLIEVDPPETGFGKHSVVWLNGKVDRVEYEYTKKV